MSGPVARRAESAWRHHSRHGRSDTPLGTRRLFKCSEYIRITPSSPSRSVCRATSTSPVSQRTPPATSPSLLQHLGVHASGTTITLPILAFVASGSGAQRDRCMSTRCATQSDAMRNGEDSDVFGKPRARLSCQLARRGSWI